MNVQPRQAKADNEKPYYVREGYTILCKRRDCMHYGSFLNCTLPEIERDGECFAPKDLAKRVQ